MIEKKPTPLPKVSAKHYDAESAKVRWRIKGNPEGPVYQGQQVIKHCRTCSNQ